MREREGVNRERRGDSKQREEMQRAEETVEKKVRKGEEMGKREGAGE